MEKRLLIIYRGWSSTRSLYKSIEDIYKGWDIVYDDEVRSIDSSSYERVAVFAWSMGTLDAIEYETNNRVDEMILVSPTLDFTLTTRPIILKKMIRRLSKDKEGCLKDFTGLCFDNEVEAEEYWEEYRDEILIISDAPLIEGLEKLMNTKLEPEKRKMSPLIILGATDKVISKKNSEESAKVYPNAILHEIDGGHNLFYSKKRELIELIKKYQKFT